MGKIVYTFRFNRPRDRGRGWVLAGFEVLGSKRVSEIASAPAFA